MFFFFFFFIWHFCICCVDVGKVKFNERYTHQRKWDNESDIPQSMGTLWLFFFIIIIIIRLRSKLFSIDFSIPRNKTWNCSQTWLNTSIHQSDYAKEKNTRQLHVRAGMQKMVIFFKRSTKDKMLMIAGVAVVWQLMESQFMIKQG